MHLTSKQVLLIAGSCFSLGAALAGGILIALKNKQIFSGLPVSKTLIWPYNVDYKNNASKSIKIIVTADDFEEIRPSLENDLTQVKVLGFDCEWTSTNTRKEPVALLQLSTVKGLCLLVRLQYFKGNLPSYLINVLKDKSILKVGVGCDVDAQKLFNDYCVVVNGCIDLRFLAQLDDTCRPRTLGLQSLASAYLNYKMEKGRDVRCSDWNAEILSSEQISYAADDALVGVKIFSKLISHLLKTESESMQDTLADAITRSLWQSAYNYCQHFTDMKFKDKPNKKNTNTKTKLDKKPSYSVRKTALYDNCKLEAPDGQLLTTCDKKKAQWYIARELADLVRNEPFTIRLRFEPSSRPTSNQDYYLLDKENICVVCGSSHSIVRKNVVPHEYRKHFPLPMKDHTSHDVLPLCVSCHRCSGHFDHILRKELADQYQAPLGNINAVQTLEDPEKRSARSAGKALVTSRSKIPLQRRIELEEIITRFYSADQISDELIFEASQLQTKYKNEFYIPHGEKVVSSISTVERMKGLVDFQRKWRQHFVEKMQPKYLPTLWRIDHNHEKILQLLEVKEENLTLADVQS